MKKILILLCAICAGTVFLFAQDSTAQNNLAVKPLIDANTDGKVSHEEFSQHHAKEVFEYYDVDKDGKITKKEVELVHQQNPTHKENAKVDLKHSDLDTNKDGVITMDEMSQAAQKSPEVKTLFNGISETAPKDNWVNQAEYDSWVGSDSYKPQGEGFPVMSISF